MITGARQRILRATAASLSWQPLAADGDPGDPGVVTVGVTSSDGTVVVAAGTATVGATTAPRTIALSVAQTAALDWLTATWKVGATTVAVTQHEIVGGFYFTTADLRGVEPSTSDTGHDTKASIIRARDEFETMVEEVCGYAFVPRFSVSRIATTRWGVLPWRYLRLVRWANLWRWNATTPLVLDVSRWPADVGGVIDLWRLAYEPYGYVDVGYEHGLDAPPSDMKRAAQAAARTAVNASRTAVPDRATSIQLADGGVITLATPGVGRWHTGIPSVDEVINRYAGDGPPGIA